MNQENEDDFWIVRAEMKENTWFIFRQNKQEIEFTIEDGMLKSFWELKQEEKQFITQKLLKKYG